MVDPVGAALGGVSLFKLIYDQSRSLYEDVQEMRSFGKNARLYNAKLRALQYTYDALMSNTVRDLETPPEYGDADHEVSRAIHNYLVIIQTHLKECQEIVTQVLSAEPSQNTLTDTRSESPVQSTTPSPTVQPGRRKRDRILNIVHRVSPGHRSKKSENGQVNGDGHHTDNSRDAQDVQPGHGGQAVGNGNTGQAQLTFDGQPVRAISKQDEASRLVRSRASLFTMAKWADHTKDDMDRALENLRVSISDLMRYLKLRPLDTAGLVRNLGAQHHVSYTPRLHPSVLARVHQSLAKINHVGDRGQRFGVSIARSDESNRKTFAWFDGVREKLRRESLVLFVQKEGQGSQSRLLAIEAVKSRDGNAAHTGWNMITDVAALVSPEPVEVEAAPSTRYAACGAIQDRSEHLTEHHHVFIEVKDWQRGPSLSTYLDDPAFLERLTTRPLIEILSHIIIAYLDFRRIRGPCRYPRLEDYLTFNPPKYDDDADVEEADTNALWPFPYWSCGFGKHARGNIPGSTLPPDEERGVALLELGLVLFQLSSGSKRVFESDRPQRADRSTAKNRALKGLKQLSDKHGLSLMNAVKSCLLGAARNEREEIRIVCACLSSLESLDAKLRDPDTGGPSQAGP